MSPGNSKRKQQRNGEQQDCKLWEQQALRSLVGWLAQPFLQQKNEVTLKPFLLHKNLAPCFYSKLAQHWHHKKERCYPLWSLGRVLLFLCSMDEGGKTSSEQHLLKSFFVSYSKISKEILWSPSICSAGRQGLLCSFAR